MPSTPIATPAPDVATAVCPGCCGVRCHLQMTWFFLKWGMWALLARQTLHGKLLNQNAFFQIVFWIKQ
jgi:hypothetical protein